MSNSAVSDRRPRGAELFKLEEDKMKWTILNFGKHVGRTLPQIVLSDPNWFFWAHRKKIFCDRLAIEAKILAARATHIRIPKRPPRRWQVEYRWDREGRFLGFDFVEAKSSCHSPLLSRLPHLDLGYVRRGTFHDKRDCRRLIQEFRRRYFQGSNLTKRRCEGFFDYEDNFTKLGRGSIFR
jgi:hypothetical protein